MNARWPSADDTISGSAFDTLHEGLTVDLIATPRQALMACHTNDSVSDVMARNTERYDFLPVLDEDGAGRHRVIGLFHAAPYFERSSCEAVVAEHVKILSEEFLIGGDASILSFVRSADTQPCRLVVSKDDITGLVSLSDLQKLPVRAALFSVITGFEMTMKEAIAAMFENEAQWLACLSADRQAQLHDEISLSAEQNNLVDKLLFTRFPDKTAILLKSFEWSQSKAAMKKHFRAFTKLRNSLAHANEYAATPVQAEGVCRTVRCLLEIRDEIAAKIGT